MLLIQKNSTLKSSVKLQYKPVSIAISIDESKAYISNRQTPLVGSISVVNLIQNKIVRTISINNSFQSLYIPSNGKYLYATSLCETGNSTLYIIDTRTDKIVKSIERIACGEAIGALPDNSKIYVSSIGEGEIDQVKVINSSSFKTLKTLDLKSRFFSFTSDNKYVFSLGNQDISIIRTEDDTVVNRLPFATTPQGIAISSEGKVFVWLPQEHRAKIFSVNECIQNINPVDPEMILKNFQTEQKRMAKFPNGYSIDDLFEQTRNMLNEVVYQVGVDLGSSFTYIQTGFNLDYKKSVFTNQYGVLSKFDNTKKILPIFQATFTDSFLVIVMKENNLEETYRSSINNIDWKSVRKFTRNFFLKRIDQLK